MELWNGMDGISKWASGIWGSDAGMHPGIREGRSSVVSMSGWKLWRLLLPECGSKLSPRVGLGSAGSFLPFPPSHSGGRERIGGGLGIICAPPKRSKPEKRTAHPGHAKT